MPGRSGRSEALRDRLKYPMRPWRVVMAKICRNRRVRRNQAGRPRTISTGPGTLPVGSRISATTRMLISTAITQAMNSAEMAVVRPAESGSAGSWIPACSRVLARRGLAMIATTNENRMIRGHPTGPPMRRRTVHAVSAVLMTTARAINSVCTPLL